MSIEFNGKVIETSPMGYLENAEDWNEDPVSYTHLRAHETS